MTVDGSMSPVEISVFAIGFVMLMSGLALLLFGRQPTNSGPKTPSVTSRADTIGLIARSLRRSALDGVEETS